MPDHPDRFPTKNNPENLSDKITSLEGKVRELEVLTQQIEQLSSPAPVVTSEDNDLMKASHARHIKTMEGLIESELRLIAEKDSEIGTGIELLPKKLNDAKLRRQLTALMTARIDLHKRTTRALDKFSKQNTPTNTSRS